MAEADLADNRSMLRDFIASIATIQGDLSNITAPPFVLDTKSTVELPSFWAERPSIFVAPAASNDPAERALLVLKWFLSSLRNQQYAGRSAAQGVKKPLNAFLGEVFLARWEDEAGSTRLVSEQVSHHPPVTACRVWNEQHGVSAMGYTRQEITFNGSVNIQQSGHATLHLARHDETYLIPLPNIKIKSILTGSPYPELQGSYYIPSTNGYTSRIDFSGKGLFSSADKKHSFEARLYRGSSPGEEETHPLFTISGNWDGRFMIHDCAKGADIETFDLSAAETTPLVTDPKSQQDPWESRRAWADVHDALLSGKMQAAADAKAKLETAQREMRKADGDGRDWKRYFFEADPHGPDEVAMTLARKIGVELNAEETVAAWRFRQEEWEAGNLEKPFRPGLMPDNTTDAAHSETEKTSNESRDGELVSNSVHGVDRSTSSLPGEQEDRVDSKMGSSVHKQTTLVTPEQTHQPHSQTESIAEPLRVQHFSREDTASVPTAQPKGTSPIPAINGARSDHQETHHETDVAARSPAPSTQNGAALNGDDAVKRPTPKSMTEAEKLQVEEFLRDRYSSRQR